MVRNKYDWNIAHQSINDMLHPSYVKSRHLYFSKEDFHCIESQHSIVYCISANPIIVLVYEINSDKIGTNERRR